MKGKKLLIGALGVLGALGLMCGVSFAGSDSDTMGVSASVSGSCTITADDLSFGSYDSNSGTTGSTLLHITCSNGLSYTVKLNNGQYADTNGHRRMKHGSQDEYLQYDLYKDSGCTERWGSSGSEVVTDTGSGSEQQKTVYGKIPSGQNTAPVGSYSDTVTATVEW
jgi:spore coat protein U-like protein